MTSLTWTDTVDFLLLVGLRVDDEHPVSLKGTHYRGVAALCIDAVGGDSGGHRSMEEDVARR